MVNCRIVGEEVLNFQLIHKAVNQITRKKKVKNMKLAIVFTLLFVGTFADLQGDLIAAINGNPCLELISKLQGLETELDELDAAILELSEYSILPPIHSHD